MNECPECGSNKIVKNAILQDIANYAEIPQRVSVDQKPEAWVFRERVHANVRAEVCGECGFIQSYATEPALLWTAYQSANSDVE